MLEAARVEAARVEVASVTMGLTVAVRVVAEIW